MSYIYSRALVAAYSEANCSDTDASALLNESHTHKPSWWHDKTMEPSRHSRFGMTYAPLTESLGAELLMWWQEDFHAKTSALPEVGPDWTAKGQGYGEKWLGLLGRFDPVSRSLKTVQLSLLEDSTGCCPTLPRLGLMLDGELYPQPMLEPYTVESASGYWPTPQTRFGTNDGDLAQLAKKCETQEEFNQMAYRAAAKKKAEYWPTPTVCGNYNRPGASATSGMGLATAVKLWPTPTASKGSSQNSLTRKDGRDRSGDRLDHAVMASENGRLNPEFCEWLMGWPIGQTELKPLATAKYQEWQQQHSLCFTETKEAA